MFVASLILVISTALFFFYFQATCQKILRRQFEAEYFQVIVKVNRLEFPSVQKSLDESDAPLDYQRLRTVLECDFLALVYLLKNAANVHQRYSYEERLLMLYFRVVFFLLTLRHLLKLRENAAILRLAAVLQYFANVVGQRVNAVRFGNLTAADYLMNL
jgi:hypothetical protein